MNMRKKLAVSLAVIFIINILIISFAQWMPNLSATYRQGSRGEVVREIQNRLIRWGYLQDTADGIFGPKTAAAVRWFQSSNGLTPDGIVGPRTLEKLGIQSSVSSNSSTAWQNDYELLARIISAESRGEPYAGQVAVGAVVLNRVKHPSFPNTLAGVIYQAGAFTAVIDGQFNQPVADTSRRAALDAMNGWDPSGGSIYYYNPVTAVNQWIRSRPVNVSIGGHLFCS